MHLILLPVSSRGRGKEVLSQWDTEVRNRLEMTFEMGHNIRNMLTCIFLLSHLFPAHSASVALTQYIIRDS